MKKRISVFILILMGVIFLAVVYLMIAAFQTTPVGLKQRVTLGMVRNCIWYGFNGNIVLSESDGEKEEIILPETLKDYGPLVYHFHLEELESFTKEFDLVYNPKGYQDKTWIVIFNAEDYKTRLFGNYVLWSDKEIRRKKGILRNLNGTDELKYYCIPD